jgi:hypothetical protein
LSASRKRWSRQQVYRGPAGVSCEVVSRICAPCLKLTVPILPCFAGKAGKVVMSSAKGLGGGVTGALGKNMKSMHEIRQESIAILRVKIRDSP